MHWKWPIWGVWLCWCGPLLALDTSADASADSPLAKFETWPVKIRQYIVKGGVHARATIQDLPGKRQSLDYLVTGLHSKSCQLALSRISQYARYSEWVGLIKESRYHLKRQEIFFRLDHTLLPFSMVLQFQLPPMKAPGDYPFRFASGFLQGLTGTIAVREKRMGGKRRCLFSLKADWQGPHSGIASTPFAFFARVLGVLTMEKLFKISRTY